MKKYGDTTVKVTAVWSLNISGEYEIKSVYIPTVYIFETVWGCGYKWKK